MFHMNKALVHQNVPDKLFPSFSGVKEASKIRIRLLWIRVKNQEQNSDSLLSKLRNFWIFL